MFDICLLIKFQMRLKQSLKSACDSIANGVSTAAPTAVNHLLHRIPARLLRQTSPLLCVRIARKHQFLVSPIVLLPAAPAKCSHVTHLETKLPFLPNLLTYAKQSSRLYQLLPNSYTQFKIPNVMHYLETVSVLLNYMNAGV